MASDSKEIVAEIPTFLRVYKDGTIERPRNYPIVPPSLEDPQTGVSSKDVVISQNPPISARIYLPKPTQIQKVPILVYFHGGGFFFESAFSQLYDNFMKTLISQVDVLVVSVEYRLAPEHHLPAAYDDCWDALKWVATHSTNCLPENAEPWLINHGDFGRIFTGGDSAGANITHNVAIRSGAENLPGGVKLVGAFIAHPVFLSSERLDSEPDGIELGDPFAVWNFVYPSAPGGHDNPTINPLAPEAPSLATLGCSKILICVAEQDVLRVRGAWYYEAVKNSGWKGKLEFFEQEGEGHVYFLFNPDSENGMKLVKLVASFIRD